MSNDKLGSLANMATVLGAVVAVLALAVAILAILATFFVPEAREWLGLEERATDTAEPQPSQLPEAFDCSFTDELLKSGDVVQWIDTPIGSGNWSGVQIRLTRAVHMPEGWVAQIGSVQDQHGPLDLSPGAVASIYSPISCRPIR